MNWILQDLQSILENSLYLKKGDRNSLEVLQLIHAVLTPTFGILRRLIK